MEVFKYLTPFIYSLLVVIWAFILIFYLKKIIYNNLNDKLLKTLLIILAIDAFRTFFESSYFGVWYTSLAGIIPIGIYNYLAQPEIVFFPKMLNLIASVLILFILIRKWIPSETSRLENIKKIVQEQTEELQQNISQLTHFGEKLRESEEKYKNAFEFFPFPVYMWQFTENQFKLAFANRAAMIKTNKKLETLLGTISNDFWENSPELNVYLKKCFYTKKTVSVEYSFSNNTNKNNETYTITFSFVPPLNVQVIMVDITEQKLIENSLLEQKLLFETMFNTIPDGVVITNTEREILVANNGMKTTFGYTANDIIGKTTELLYANSENYKEAGKKVYNEYAKNPDGLYITQYKKKDNRKFPGETFGNKLLNKEGKWIGNVGIMRDISERIKFIEEIEIAKEKAEESDRLKSAFLANMSHEIRTPMNGILGFADLLKNPNLTGEKQEKYIQIIEKAGTRMLNIINDIIDISKIESGQMTLKISESNINKQIEYIYTFFKPEVEAKGIKFLIKNNLQPKLAEINTDSEKVYAILTNLVKNALKFTSKGTIELGCNKQGEYLVFYVKDTGIGISNDRHEAIFERFIQADIEDKMARQGAGLGLAITKFYVELLGGKIWVESEKDVGSTFYFTLPYQIKTELNLQDKNYFTDEIDQNSIPKLKILIAEDDEDSEMLISILVEEYCIDYLKAKNGKEAVEISRNNPDTNLILMDIQMPEMNGYEATRQIRQFNKDVIIIAQTAFGLSGDTKKALEAGCNDYLSKPISKNKLKFLIQNYFIN